MFNIIENLLNKINSPIAKITENISGFLLLIMTLIVLFQVAFRYILNIPLSWSDEASRFLMIYMTYLCLPIIYLEDKNIAMTFVTDKLKDKRIYEVFMIVTHVVSLMLFAVWIRFGWIFYQTGSVMADSLPISMYVIYIIPPVMLTVCCSFALQKLFGSIHRFIHFKKPQELNIANQITE